MDESRPRSASLGHKGLNGSANARLNGTKSFSVLSLPTASSRKPRSWYRRHPVFLLLLFLSFSFLLGLAFYSVVALRNLQDQLLSLRDWRDGVVEDADSLDVDSAGFRQLLRRLRSKRCVNGEWCPEALKRSGGDDDDDDEDSSSVMHLKGLNLTGKSAEFLTELELLKERREVRVRDWEVDLKRSRFFSFEDGAIRVEKSGVYILYSQFYLINEGQRCSYRLRHGKQNHEINVCIQDLNVSVGTSFKPLWRPCFLGLPRVLQKGALVEIDLYDPYGHCWEKENLIKVLPHSYWGIIRLGN